MGLAITFSFWFFLRGLFGCPLRNYRNRIFYQAAKAQFPQKLCKVRESPSLSHSVSFQIRKLRLIFGNKKRRVLHRYALRVWDVHRFVCRAGWLARQMKQNLCKLPRRQNIKHQQSPYTQFFEPLGGSFPCLHPPYDFETKLRV